MVELSYWPALFTCFASLYFLLYAFQALVVFWLSNMHPPCWVASFLWPFCLSSAGSAKYLTLPVPLRCPCPWHPPPVSTAFLLKPLSSTYLSHFSMTHANLVAFSLSRGGRVFDLPFDNHTAIQICASDSKEGLGGVCRQLQRERRKSMLIYWLGCHALI